MLKEKMLNPVVTMGRHEANMMHNTRQIVGLNSGTDLGSELDQQIGSPKQILASNITLKAHEGPTNYFNERTTRKSLKKVFDSSLETLNIANINETPIIALKTD